MTKIERIAEVSAKAESIGLRADHLGHGLWNVFGHDGRHLGSMSYNRRSKLYSAFGGKLSGRTPGTLGGLMNLFLCYAR